MTSHRDLVTHLRRDLTAALADLGQLEATLDAAHAWATPLAATNSGPNGSGGASDPTGRAALENFTGSDDTRHVYARLRSTIDTIGDNCHDLRLLIAQNRPLTRDEARKLYAGARGRTSSLADCTEVLCDDKALPGDTRCDNCRTWLTAHPDANVVPRTVIETRTRVRAHRATNRRHINGPLADQEADRP